MIPDRITDALDPLARTQETHDGAPADTNIARAQVHATLAVAEQLDKLVRLLTSRDGAGRQMFPLVDTSEEGCVDHIPVARAGCRECAQTQGGAR